MAVSYWLPFDTERYLGKHGTTETDKQNLNDFFQEETQLSNKISNQLRRFDHFTEVARNIFNFPLQLAQMFALFV